MDANEDGKRAYGEPPEGCCRPLIPVARPRRTVAFPVAERLGTVLLRGPRARGTRTDTTGAWPVSALGRSARRWWDDGWREAGPAQGCVRVPAGCELGLRLAREADGQALVDLCPGDLQCLSIRQAMESVLRLLGELEGLVALDLWGAEVDDDAMFAVAACRNLEALDLWGTRVGPAGLARLGCLAGLRRLTAPGDSWGDDAAAGLGLFPGLHVLDLSGTMIGDQGIDRMDGVPLLTRLSLWGTRVTDRALPLLARLPRLSGLDLGDTAVTDAGLDALVGLRRLRSVSLQDALVSREGLERFRAARPDCRIEPRPDRGGYHGVRSRAARPGLRGV
ncbi:MAG TPA: hypothetical protein VFW71_15280 [Actinomycetota bacterium]|nr:hypothetical protein [Actinomycetota bacterium]